MQNQEQSLIPGQIIRGERYIELFMQFINAEYGLAVTAISPAKRGYYGETWKIETTDITYFAKVVYPTVQQMKYRRSFPVVERLTSSGIDTIPPILKTVSGELYSEFDGATVGLFQWLDGENIQNEDTKIQEYRILAKVYSASTGGLDIPQQVFDTQAAQTLIDSLKRIDNEEILDFFKSHTDIIKHYTGRLATFAERVATLEIPRFITHGDAGGNIIVGTDGQH
jgi:hypothetical protein